jgi:LacI family transcriptional regulator
VSPAQNAQPPRDAGRHAPTVHDVAREAGVSIGTVSRTVAGKSVRPGTRTKVEEAIRTLGYRPNLAARSLRTRESSSIGVILPTMADPFWGSVGEEIVEAAAVEGISTMVASTRNDAGRVAGAIGTFVQRRVDAIVAVGLSVVLAEFIELAHRIPCVFVNRDAQVPRSSIVAAAHAPLDQLDDPDQEASEPGYSVVRTDDTAGSSALVEHLLTLGHTRMAFCGGEATESAVRRVIGFRRALQAQHGECLAIDLGGDSPRAAYEAATRICTTTQEAVAIVGASDLSAMAVLRAAHETRRRVPGDVSVAGFDGLHIAEYLEPPLTTLRQRTSEISSIALDMVGRRVGIDTPPESVLVAGELVVRDSTGPPAS